MHFMSQISKAPMEYNRLFYEERNIYVIIRAPAAAWLFIKEFEKNARVKHLARFSKYLKTLKKWNASYFRSMKVQKDGKLEPKKEFNSNRQSQSVNSLMFNGQLQIYSVRVPAVS